MSNNLELSCRDFAYALKPLIKKLPFLGDPCTNPNAVIFSTLGSFLDDDEKKGVEEAKKMMTTCHDSVCGTGPHATLTITCDQVKKIVSTLLSDEVKVLITQYSPSPVPELLKYIKSTDDICSFLNRLGKENINDLLGFLDVILKAKVPERNKENIRVVLDCLCPNIPNKLNCNQIKSLMQYIITNQAKISALLPEAKKQIFDLIIPYIMDSSEICMVLRLIGPTYLDELFKYIHFPISKKYILECVCPDMDKPLNCTEVKQILEKVIKDPNLIKYLPKGFTITKPEDICILKNFKSTSPDIQNLIKSVISSNEFKCICPDDKPTPGPIEPKPDTKKAIVPHKYNKPIVYATLLILAGLMFIPLLVILFSKKEWGPKMALLGILILTNLIFFLIILKINPKCIYKPCPISGDKWVSVKGRYVGQYDYNISSYNGSISAVIDIIDDNRIKINSLKCTGKGCPKHNLIDDCKDNTIVYLDTKNKTAAGYQLYGKCIDNLMKIPTAGGEKAVTGIWFVREKNEIKLQLGLNICIKNIGCIGLIPLISLKKIEK